VGDVFCAILLYAYFVPFHPSLTCIFAAVHHGEEWQTLVETYHLIYLTTFNVFMSVVKRKIGGRKLPFGPYVTNVGTVGYGWGLFEKLTNYHAY
jgi:hypothetical protein